MQAVLGLVRPTDKTVIKGYLLDDNIGVLNICIKVHCNIIPNFVLGRIRTILVVPDGRSGHGIVGDLNVLMADIGGTFVVRNILYKKAVRNNVFYSEAISMSVLVITIRHLAGLVNIRIYTYFVTVVLVRRSLTVVGVI